MRKITIDPRLEHVNIVVIGEASSWESVSQISSFCEKSCSSRIYISLMRHRGSDGLLQCVCVCVAWRALAMKVRTGGI